MFSKLSVTLFWVNFFKIIYENSNFNYFELLHRVRYIIFGIYRYDSAQFVLSHVLGHFLLKLGLKSPFFKQFLSIGFKLCYFV